MHKFFWWQPEELISTASRVIIKFNLAYGILLFFEQMFSNSDLSTFFSSFAK